MTRPDVQDILAAAGVTTAGRRGRVSNSQNAARRVAAVLMHDLCGMATLDIATSIGWCSHSSVAGQIEHWRSWYAPQIAEARAKLGAHAEAAAMAKAPDPAERLPTGRWIKVMRVMDAVMAWRDARRALSDEDEAGRAIEAERVYTQAEEELNAAAMECDWWRVHAKAKGAA